MLLAGDGDGGYVAGDTGLSQTDAKSLPPYVRLSLASSAHTGDRVRGLSSPDDLTGIYVDDEDLGRLGRAIDARDQRSHRCHRNRGPVPAGVSPPSPDAHEQLHDQLVEALVAVAASSKLVGVAGVRRQLCGGLG